jgi:hypothetical protein
MGDMPEEEIATMVVRLLEKAEKDDVTMHDHTISQEYQHKQSDSYSLHNLDGIHSTRSSIQKRLS